MVSPLRHWTCRCSWLSEGVCRCSRRGRAWIQHGSASSSAQYWPANRKSSVTAASQQKEGANADPGSTLTEHLCCSRRGRNRCYKSRQIYRAAGHVVKHTAGAKILTVVVSESRRGSPRGAQTRVGQRKTTERHISNPTAEKLLHVAAAVSASGGRHHTPAK